MATTVSDVSVRTGHSARFERGLVLEHRTQVEFSWSSTSSAAHVILAEVRADSAIPAQGASLSFGGFGTVYLEECTIELDGQHKGHGRADLVYRRWELTPVTIRGGSGLIEVPTQKDKDGNDLEVSHAGQTQVGTINKRIRTRQLILDRVIVNNDPATFAETYNGRVNSAAWRSGAARTWLCTVEDYEPLDQVSATNVYRVRFRFDYREDGWDEQVIFRDPETGRPPEGLVSGTGFITAESAGEADFTGVLSA